MMSFDRFWVALLLELLRIELKESSKVNKLELILSTLLLSSLSLFLFFSIFLLILPLFFCLMFIPIITQSFISFVFKHNPKRPQIICKDYKFMKYLTIQDNPFKWIAKYSIGMRVRSIAWNWLSLPYSFSPFSFPFPMLLFLSFSIFYLILSHFSLSHFPFYKKSKSRMFNSTEPGITLWHSKFVTSFEHSG